MTDTTYCGVTFKLISGDELANRVAEISDRWGPNWPDDGTKRLVMDTLNDCAHFIDHYEDAARQKALAAIPPHQQAVADLIADMTSGKVLGIPQDDEREDDRCRKAGAV